MRVLIPEALADKMDAAAEQMAGQRREVTVLTLSIADLAMVSQQQGSEDAYLLTDEAMRLLATVIYRYEGTVDKYTGDGLIALFGLPVAHENDPERAIRAALDMQTALEPLGARVKKMRGFDLRAGIGIHTGLVIAGKIDSDHGVSYTVIGDTVDLADSLHRAAEPGTILTSFSTYQRTRPLFEYRTLSEIKVGSKAIKAFQSLRLRARPGRVRGVPGLQTPMIGRVAGLAQLNEALTRVLHERRVGIALVTGEAGVGKSRLVAEFTKDLAQRSVSVYRGNCLTYARSKPMFLLADMLRSMIQASENMPDSTQRKALAGYLRSLGLSADELLPYLTDVLGISQQDEKVEKRIRSIEGTARRQLAHTALRQVILEEVRTAPVVLIFEDLHWIDPASRDFLEKLIDTMDEGQLMLVLVSRQAERETVVRPLIATAQKHPAGFADIPVRPLSESETKLLVDQLLPQAEGEVAPVKARIVGRAEGNPLYAEEIVRMLLDEGGIVRENGTYRILPLADDLLRSVPGTLKGLIMSRLDRLPEKVRETLHTASVLGPVFPAVLLQSLLDNGGQGAGPDVQELEARQLLACDSSVSGQNCVFRHALIQEVVYDSLLKRARQRLHDRAAQIIEQGAFWPSEQQIEALAYHYARTHDPSRALPYLVAAADSAAQRCAYETAIQHYRHAQELLEDGDAGNVELHLRVQMGLGQALKFVGEYAAAGQTLRAALRYLLRPDVLGQASSTVEVLVRGLRELADIQIRGGAPGEAIAYLQAGLDLLGEDGMQRYPDLWRLVIDRLALVRFRQGQLDEAYQLANSGLLSLDLAHGEDQMTLASLYNTLGGVLWQQGNLAEAAEYVERSLELYQQMAYLWGVANAYSNLGILHYRLGNWLQALEEWQKALEIRRSIGDVPQQAITLSNLGHLRMSMGKHKQAREDFEHSLSLGQRLGDNRIMANSMVSLAHLAIIESRFVEARKQGEQALSLADSIGSSEVQIQARWLLALAEAEIADVEMGLDSVRQAVDLARKSGLHDLEADCLRTMGSLRARTGAWLEAETHFHESIEVCLQQEDPYRQGLALLELGRMYHNLARAGDLAETGWQSRALDLLGQAVGLFERLGAAHDLSQAQAILSEIQMAAGSPAGLPEGAWHTAAVAWIGLGLSPNADEEKAFEVMATATAAIMAIAEEYRGQVIRRRDGVTMVFGAPSAFEDDTERAVLAASRSAEYVAGLNQQHEVPLTCRVAVSRGSLVAGLVGPRFHAEFVVKGTPVDQAQRLAESAPLGRIWVTEGVRAATERLFEYQPAPPAVAGRLAEPTLAALVGLRERPAPTRGLPGLEAKFIGRQSALQAMVELSKNLDQGLGGLIWIEGEPGIGKSRLMREYAAMLNVDAALIWRGRCRPHRSSHAFSLFSDLLSRALNLQPTDSAEQIRDKVDQHTHGWPRDAQSTRPHLEALLGMQPAGLTGERLASLQPEQLQRQIFVALRKLFKSLSSRQPLVLLMDDLHWIDPVSAELLLFLLTMVTSVPIIFVCAQRRQGADAPNDRLVRTQSLISSQTIRLRLERLSLVESEMLVSELLSQPDLPPKLVSTIVQRSEGNPYFIEEYVRMLIDQGYLHRGIDRWELEPNLDLDDLPLPSSLDTLIRSRIDALPPELKQVVEYGATVGSPFEARLLESIPGLSNVQANLSRLESRLIVQPATEAGRWQFNHSLIETIAYNSMLKAQRRRIHRQVGEAMEARWSGNEIEHAEVLAYHFSQAGGGVKTLTYLVLAGERAAARYANEEALGYFEQAAHQLATLSDEAVDLRLRVAAGLGDVHRALGQHAASKAALDMGLALAQSRQLPGELQAGLYRRLGETARRQGELDVAYEQLTRALTLLGEPATRTARTEAANLLNNLAWVHFSRGELDEARQRCEQSLAYAERAGALNELSAGENLLGGINYSQNRWTSALQHTTRAMVLREQLGYTWGVAATLSNLGILAQLAGQWSKAWSFFERSLALRQEIGDTEGVANAHNNLGTLARDQGKLDLAKHHLRASLEVAIPFQLGIYVIHANMGLAQVLLWEGDLDAARCALATSLREAQALGAKDALAELSQIEAQILAAEGAPAQARARAEHSASLAAEIGIRTLEASAWRVAAEAELQSGDAPAARRTLLKAQEILGSVTDELLSGRTLTLAGRIALQEGRYVQAEQDLRAAQEILTRLGASRDLIQVQDALRRLPRPEASGVLRALPA